MCGPVWATGPFGDDSISLIGKFNVNNTRHDVY